MSFKVYETPNLLSLGTASITMDTSPSNDADHTASNLIQNLQHRSPGNSVAIYEDDTDTAMDYKSCYETDNTVLAADGHRLVLGIDLGWSYF